MVLPFSALGATGAVYAWLLFSVACLAAAWWIAAPGQGVLRGLWLLFALAWYPDLYGLGLAQPDLVLMLVVAASWRLAEGGRQYLAGAVLAFALLKPQLFLLVPLVLLAAGRWRMVVGWAAVAAVLAAASLAAIGSQGASDYRALLGEAQRVVNNRYFTLAYVFGPGYLSYLAQAAVAVVAAAGGRLNRRSSLAKLFALGIVATALGATYWHLQDYTVLVLAAWLYWRTPAANWQRWWLAVVVAGGELAWPLHPLPILIGVAAWLAFLLAPERDADRIAAPARAAA